jgi:hypothetical protein
MSASALSGNVAPGAENVKTMFYFCHAAAPGMLNGGPQSDMEISFS